MFLSRLYSQMWTSVLETEALPENKEYITIYSYFHKSVFSDFLIRKNNLIHNSPRSLPLEKKKNSFEETTNEAAILPKTQIAEQL